MCVTLHLSRRAVLLDEGAGDRWLDYLVGGDMHTVELAEARDQSRKPQGHIKLLRVQRVPSRRHPCKQINGVSNYLGHVNAHPCQDGIHQLALRQREVGVVVTRQDIAEQQCHPYLGQGSHAGAHDPYSPPRRGPGEILPQYAQQPSDGLLIEAVCLVPPLAEITLLVLLQNQWVAQELAEGICIEGDLVTPHPQAHVPNPLLSGPGVGIEFYDYLRVECSHRGH